MKQHCRGVVKHHPISDRQRFDMLIGELAHVESWAADCHEFIVDTFRHTQGRELLLCEAFFRERLAWARGAYSAAPEQIAKEKS